MLGRHATLMAALLLLGALAPVLAGALTERWVVEERAETRVILGPRQLQICGEGPCRAVIYSSAIESLAGRVAGAKGAEERERLESALERMRFNRRKGLQILVPALVASLLFAGVALLLLLRRRGGLSYWTRGSVRFLTCGIALGLMAFAVVYADGVSHLPVEATRVRWGISFYLAMGGSAVAFLGGLLAGVGPSGEPAGEGEVDRDREVPAEVAAGAPAEVAADKSEHRAG